VKKAEPPTQIALVCEIVARDAMTATAVAQIAKVCAQDVRQPLVVKSRAQAGVSVTVLTLHLPAALAAGQTPAWCLACRLACFCPDARVSVLVLAAPEFDERRQRQKVPRKRARVAA